MDTTDPKRKAAIVADIEAGLTYSEICFKHKVSSKTVRKFGKAMPQNAEHFGTLAAENRTLRDRIRKITDKEREFESLLLRAAELMPKHVPVRAGKHTDAKPELDFHALRSDEQAGAFITALDTNGTGGYSSSIYVERLHAWADKILTFHRQDKRSLGLNKLVIHRLGDWLEGETIYPGQAFYIDAPVVDLIYQTVIPHEVEVMRRLASHFESIEQFCVIGNHGRAGKKGDHHWRTNFEYIAYRTLQAALASQPNVKTFVSESMSMIVQHGQYRFLLNHGGHLSSNYGVPYYAMDRTYKALPNLYGMIIDLLLVGHRHTPVNLQDQVMMNGCMPGGSELSVNVMLTSSRPSQKIFYFDQEKGVNRESSLYLSDHIRLTPDKDGIYTPHS